MSIRTTEHLRTAQLGGFSVLMIKFTQPITKIDVWDAEASPSDRDGLFWIFSPKYRDKYEELGMTHFKIELTMTRL